MIFDCIIMNPPYNRNLHLKILAEAIKHLKDDNSVCVNLSPVGKLQTAWRRNKIAKELSFLNTCTASVTPIYCDDAVRLFELGNIGTDLGIWTIKYTGNTDPTKLGKDLTEHHELIEKMTNAIKNQPMLSTILVSANNAKNEKYFVKFVIGLSLKNNGGHGASSYAATSINFTTASKFTPGNHCAYVICKNLNEQINCWKIYTHPIIRFYYMTAMGSGTEYDILPKFDFSKEWTTKDLCEVFTLNIKDQKIIEETMKPYM